MILRKISLGNEIISVHFDNKTDTVRISNHKTERAGFPLKLSCQSYQSQAGYLLLRISESENASEIVPSQLIHLYHLQNPNQLSSHRDFLNNQGTRCWYSLFGESFKVNVPSSVSREGTSKLYHKMHEQTNVLLQKRLRFQSDFYQCLWIHFTVLHNMKLYHDEIVINEQILKIDWERHGHDNSFHDNAKRDIADAYADLGDMVTSYKLYKQYLGEEPLWGWGWIGYFRQLHDNKNPRYEEVLDVLYSKIVSGTVFRNMEDLYRELCDEFEALEAL